MTDRRLRMIRHLQSLRPTCLEVVNDSARHVGHAGDNGTGETHYMIKIGSPLFAALSRVEGHRLIHAALLSEFDKGLHAITIQIVPQNNHR